LENVKTIAKKGRGEAKNLPKSFLFVGIDWKIWVKLKNI